MQQSSTENQGFTTQQKQELLEIVKLAIRPLEQRIQELEERIKAMDLNIESMDLRLIRVEREVKQGFADLKKDIDNLREDINAYRSNFVKDDERIKLLTRRVTKLERKLLVRS